MDATLRPMTDAELTAYLAATFEDYKAELITSGRTPAEAEQNVEENSARSFKDGKAINGNELFCVMQDGERVGVLWIGPREGDFWWIYDIEIEEAHRGKGLGRATMLLAEQAVRERGGQTLGLNVFGHNTTARSLYDSLGYQPMSIQMRKQL